MLSERELDEVADSLVEAAAVPRRWPDALRGVAKALDAASAHFVIWDRAEEKATVAITGRNDVELSSRYSNEFGRLDPTRRAIEALPCGSWLANHTVLSRSEFEEHRYNREFLLPSGFPYVIKTRVTDNIVEGRYSVFGFVRTAAAEPFDPGHLEKTSRAVGPHLRRAATLYQRLSPARVDGELAEHLLNRLPLGILLVSLERKVLFANDAALVALDGARLSTVGGTFHSADPDVDSKLRLLIRAQGRGGALRISPTPTRVVVLSVTPLPDRIDLRSMGGNRTNLILLSTHDREAPRVLGPALHDLYGLTHAEAKVAGLVGIGLSLTDIAAEHGIALGTVRAHLKSIFGKTGATRQPELVALVQELRQTLPS
jgi:DNA-binding CsgD family transcriptional regulator